MARMVPFSMRRLQVCRGTAISDREEILKQGGLLGPREAGLETGLCRFHCQGHNNLQHGAGSQRWVLG